MSEPVEFFVPGQPVGKGRHRTATRDRFGRQLAKPRNYTPEKTVAYEALVGLLGGQAMRGRPLITGPVSMTLTIGFEIPKSYSKAKQAAALSGTLRPVVKPDLSNVLKAAEDGLNGVVWIDDAQVVESSIRKIYLRLPGVSVTIRELETT